MSTYRVVFQVSEADLGLHEQVLRNVANTMADLGEGTRVAIVAHGPGLQLVLGATGQSDALAELVSAGVELLACGNTMRRLDVTDDQLLPGVAVVSAGVAEIVRRQQDGWAYVRP